MLSICYRCDTVRFLESHFLKISDDLANMHNLAAVRESLKCISLTPKR